MTAPKKLVGCSDTMSYVEKLREEDFGQLVKFCKMHIATVVEMDSDQFEGLFAQQQSSVITPSSNFRQNLTAMLPKKRGSRKANSPFYEWLPSETDPKLEMEIRKLIAYLRVSKNLCHEGLFRKTGSIMRQKELSDKLESIQSSDIANGPYTVHDCASVLKAKLASLSEPLLMDRYFNAFMYTDNMSKHDDRLKFVTNLLQMLPSGRYKVAKSLFALLHQVTLFSVENKMDANNLGSVIAPNILCPKNFGGADLQSLAGPMQRVISFIILNTPTVFQVPEILSHDSKRHLQKTFMSSSEDSLLSLDSIESPAVSRQRRKRPSANMSLASCDTLDEPIDTVLTYTVRRQATQDSKNAQDTEVELAKLYAHVSALPESAKKRKLMKQFNDANGYHHQARLCRNHSRSRSLGESLKRRFSKRSRLKSLNISGAGDLASSSSGNAADNTANDSSPLVTITNIVTSADAHMDDSVRVKSSITAVSRAAEEHLEITSLDTSPLYRAHRTSRQNLRSQSESNMESLGSENASSPRPKLTVGKNFVDGSTIFPKLKKPLLPQHAMHMEGTPPMTGKLRSRLTKEYKNTPPVRPRKVLSVMDSAIDV